MSSLWLRPAIDDEIKDLRNELFAKRRESSARLGDGAHHKNRELLADPIINRQPSIW